MIKKIERPFFSIEILKEHNDIMDEWNYIFNTWFDKEVEPINEALTKTLRVYSNHPSGDIGTSNWNTDNMFFDNPSLSDITQKALLINIEPVKQDTIEDVLRDIVRFYNGSRFGSFDQALLTRAKALLDGE